MLEDAQTRAMGQLFGKSEPLSSDRLWPEAVCRKN